MRCNTLIGGFILNDAEGVNCIPLLQPPCDIVSFILFVYTLHLLHTAALIFISIIGSTVGTQTQFLHPRMLNCVSQDIRYLPNSSVANYLCCSQLLVGQSIRGLLPICRHAILKDIHTGLSVPSLSRLQKQK